MPEQRESTSRIGLGLAAVARPAYITSGRDEDLGEARDVGRLRERSHALLDAAHARGVRYVDVARSYGLAEEFLAGWLAARPDVDDVVIGSKWGYRYVGGWRADADVHEVKDHSPEAFAEQVAVSLGLLGDRLSIYHVHSVTPESPALGDPVLLRRLGELRATGVRVGFSTSGPSQADVIRRGVGLTVDGVPLFTSVESTWNLLETSAGPALAEAADAGVTVILKEVVANGRLAPGVDDDTAKAAVSAREVADRLGIGVDQVATSAALAQPWAWRVLSGAVTVRHLEENLDSERLRLSADDLAALTAVPQEPARYWTERSARAWS